MVKTRHRQHGSESNRSPRIVQGASTTGKGGGEDLLRKAHGQHLDCLSYDILQLFLELGLGPETYDLPDWLTPFEDQQGRYGADAVA
jgi:hypothetical protein